MGGLAKPVRALFEAFLVIAAANRNPAVWNMGG